MQLIGLVKPRGWIQIEELDLTKKHHDNGVAMQQILDLIEEIIAKSGVGYGYVQKLEGWFKEAGLTDVQQHLLTFRSAP